MIYIIEGLVLFFLILLFFRYKPIFRGIIYNYPDKADRYRFEKNTIQNNLDLQFSFNKVETEIDYVLFLNSDCWTPTYFSVLTKKSKRWKSRTLFFLTEETKNKN